MAESNADVGQRIQEKFQFYILGLTFTLLGLAVQTATFGVSAVSDSLELLGWALLFISALALAFRLEWTPQIYHLFDVQEEIKQLQRQLHDAQLQGSQHVTVYGTGENLDVEEVMRRLDTKLSTAKGQIERIDKGAGAKYMIHRYGFVLGLAAILSARAWQPAIGLFGGA